MAASAAPATVSAEASVPFVYRLVLTTIEPLFATSGALMAFRSPAAYLSTMTRGATFFLPDTAFVYTELGGAWLLFAFLEAVVLRAFDDLRLWRLLCAGMLLSDAAYCHSAAQAVGGWAQWVVLSRWTAEDWLVFWSTAPMVLVRVLIVLGVGVRVPRQDATRGRERKSE
ncbi:hypothetical protein VTK73DRAFT_9981 [Phialemonium thermophilum]|uniref:DUF7704 domain-containing protein n=1 Tax=Phialemonium thermophilum TaxID=223376 RepID=A0ABR3VZ80_9PEZI